MRLRPQGPLQIPQGDALGLYLTDQLQKSLAAHSYLGKLYFNKSLKSNRIGQRRICLFPLGQFF